MPNHADRASEERGVVGTVNSAITAARTTGWTASTAARAVRLHLVAGHQREQLGHLERRSPRAARAPG